VLRSNQDGFHLTKAELFRIVPPQEALCRRGAPFTFDAHAFVSTVELLRYSPVCATKGASPAIKVPSFDHAVQDPAKNDIIIPLSTKVVILQGSYTLLDLEPWNRIAVLAHEK